MGLVVVFLFRYGNPVNPVYFYIFLDGGWVPQPQFDIGGKWSLCGW